MASLTEKRPGVWLARVFLPPAGDRPGRQVGKTFRGSKRSVRAEVAEWEAALRGTASVGVDATVADLLAMWQEARRDDWQPLTVRDNERRTHRIVAMLGDVKLRDLDVLAVDAWLKELRRRGVGEGAIRTEVTMLRSACSWGVSRKLLRSNPVADAKPRVRSNPRTARPDPDQVVAMLEAAASEGARAGLGLRLSGVTGARAAEVVALKWTDLDGDRLTIARQRHSVDGEVLVRDRTKTGRSRVVVLDPGTVAAIEAWHAEADEIVGAPTEWMLSEPGDADPPSPRWLYEVFKRSATQAGVPVGRKAGFVLHDLRHWTASTALRAGHDPVTVAARLGHSPNTLLRIYAQEIEEGQAEVAASLAARLDG